MHDEVSETENIRKNLAIERMIVEGCEILLDTSQTFVRQGKSCQPVFLQLDRHAEVQQNQSGHFCSLLQSCVAGGNIHVR